MANLFEYSSAVRGFHYYRKYWNQKESQTLDCVHEKENPFVFFAIKVMYEDSGATVGHLPMENSGAAKFLLDRDARVIATLTSSNYCVSPLVHGGLEIPCYVEIFMSPTVKNKELIDIYQNYVDLLYYEREDSNIVGSFITGEDDASAGTSNLKSPEISKKTRTSKTPKNLPHKDIHSFFVSQLNNEMQRKKDTGKTVVVLSDTDSD